MTVKKTFFQKLAGFISPTPPDSLIPSGNFIQKNGITVDISDPSVSLQDILVFFEKRLPWLEIVLSPQLPDDADSDSTKEQVFNHFAEVLEAQYTEWTEAFKQGPLKVT